MFQLQLFFLLHCDEWDRVVALPRHKFVNRQIWYRHPNSEAGNDEIQNVQIWIFILWELHSKILVGDKHIIGPGSHIEYPTGTKNSNFVEDHPRNIPAKFEIIQFHSRNNL
jgi:hypothetical protein